MQVNIPTKDNHLNWTQLSVKIIRSKGKFVSKPVRPYVPLVQWFYVAWQTYSPASMQTQYDILYLHSRKLQPQFSLNSATQRLTMVQDWNLYTIVEVLIFPWDKVFTSQHHELITTVKEWLSLVNIGYVLNHMKTNNMQQF